MIKAQNIFLKIYALISRFINNLSWIYCSYTLHRKLKKKPFRNKTDILLNFETWNYSLLLVVICFQSFSSLYHTLSYIVTCCISHCHLFALVAIRCHSLYQSLSPLLFFVPLLVICCHLLYYSLSLVVSGCSTRLSSYKRSFHCDIFQEKSAKTKAVNNMFLINMF